MKHILTGSCIIIAVLAFRICASADTSFVNDSLSRIEADMLDDADYASAKKKLCVLVKDYPHKANIYKLLCLAHYGLMEYQRAHRYILKCQSLKIDDTFKDQVTYISENIKKNLMDLRFIERINSISVSATTDKAKEFKDIIRNEHLKMIEILLSEETIFPALVLSHINWIKRNFPKTPGIYRLAGDIQYSSMLYDKAEASYRESVKRYPDDPDLNKTFADCLVALGNFDEAKVYYAKSAALYESLNDDKSVRYASDVKDIIVSLPKKYSDIDDLILKGDYKKAERLSRQRLSLNRSDYAAMTQLGEILWRTGKRKQAINLFKRVVKSYPGYPVAHFHLGRAYIFEKRTEAGMKEFSIFDKKMKNLPDLDDDTKRFYISALHYIGYLYFTMKNYQKAESICIKILYLDPNDQRAHYNLATCYYIFYRDLSRTYAEFLKVSEIDPESDLAESARYHIDYLRRNPDPLFLEDLNFIYDEE